MSNSFEVEFVGGPLDGVNLLHPDQPDQRYILRVEASPDGYYEYRPDLRYHWVSIQPNLL